MSDVDTIVPGQGMADELDPDEAALFEEGTPEAPAAETPPPADAKTEETPPPAEGDGEMDEIEEIPNKGRFVRHAALHEERSRRKELQKQLNEYQTQYGQARENQARLDERLRLLNEALSSAPANFEQPGQPGQPGQPQTQAVPKPEEDPFAYMRHLESMINQIGETTHQAQQRFQEEDTYGAVKQAFQTDAKAYLQKQPDFLNAYQHLMGSRDRELQAIGYTDQTERARVIANEEMMIVAQALQSGKSPAELFYALSAERGYRKPEPAPAPAAAAPAATATQKVQQVRQAAQSNRSLSGAGGGTAPVITAESLANMSEAEFARVYESLSKADRRQIFGG